MIANLPARAARENLSKSACPQAEVHQIDPTSSFKELSGAPKAQFTCQIAARQPRVRKADALFFTQRWSLASNDDLTNRYAAHGSTWGLLRAKNSKICLLLTMKHDQNLSKICLRESKSANRKSASLEGKILTCPKIHLGCR